MKDQLGTLCYTRKYDSEESKLFLDFITLDLS